MNKANECTCPSGDGSLVHPCPAHPAVEQAGEDERAAKPGLFCRDCGSRLMVRGVCSIYCPNCVKAQARAALAQPSPVQTQPSPAPTLRAAIDVANDRFEVPVAKWGTDLIGEEERPEVVAYRTIGRHEKHQHPHCALNYYKQNAEDQAAHWRERGCEVSEDELMTVAQHERIVGPLRYKAELYDEVWALVTGKGYMNVTTAISVLESERDAALVEVERLRESKGDPVGSLEKCMKVMYERDEHAKRLEVALARVEQQERTIAGMNEAHAKLAGLYEAAQAQHSVPEGWKLVPIEPLLNMMSDKDHDTRITAERQLLSILADAPGNLVPQAWLDVQAERRRQITAEGWTPEHDDEHDSGELAAAGAAYALHAADHLNPYSQGDGGDEAPSCWPWHDGIAGRGEGPEKTEPAWWKPSTPRRDLVKACALALAEIERLDRAAHGKEGV
ncbi:hypothetical protein MRQ32_017365 [Pseudomonas aeruginosa]|uniref:hypothetical protein n=1 Tax=Pseudomonas aeruginosa TaxID=287 RepID=UPI0020A699A3|nr:hypothetical protein [Pseudomonas aeruginosa]MCJ2343377.1 hypothetical protein [Pseudomonas aeruginosa]MCJ2362753.1 hypothetical protein [Pseudomonas aeruginosa]